MTVDYGAHYWLNRWTRLSLSQQRRTREFYPDITFQPRWPHIFESPITERQPGSNSNTLLRQNIYVDKAYMMNWGQIMLIKCVRMMIPYYHNHQ